MEDAVVRVLSGRLKRMTKTLHQAQASRSEGPVAGSNRVLDAIVVRPFHGCAHFDVQCGGVIGVSGNFHGHRGGGVDDGRGYRV